MINNELTNEIAMPLIYEKDKPDFGYRIDLLVNAKKQ
jgi:hypothetical protein